MAAPKSRRISAASARAHTRSKKPPPPIFLRPGVLKKLLLATLVGFAAWTYKAIQPPQPPPICGDSGGPPVTSQRVELRDGRHLSFLEAGVPKDVAKHKVVFIHGFSSCRLDLPPFSQELAEELGIYYLAFDRPGYGESDPDPRRTAESFALDVEELADKLGLGPKFYVIGFSMGGEHVWPCLKYIPHRLAGAALVAPVSNFWWRGFPGNVSKQAYGIQPGRDKLALGIAHYAPWLAYWWNTQRWFPSSSAVAGGANLLSNQDKEIILSSPRQHPPCMVEATKQGVYESLIRDMLIGFGSWEFDPLEFAANPLSGSRWPVQLWHGAEDLIFPPALSRYIAQRLPWIRYQELPNAGHLFPLVAANADAIVRALILDSPPPPAASAAS